MDIVALYSFNGGRELMEAEHRLALNEIYEVIRGVDAAACLTKQSREKTRAYQMLYSPRALNRCFKTGFYPLGWRSVRVACHYPTAYYVDGYTAAQRERGEFREMDFVKEKVGVEVQFGKYSFMVYNVAAKMTIFHNLQHIDVGVEIVPVKEFARRMSTGVSYFEQFVWDLEQRGVSNIDIPVLIIGIASAR